jgi:hypothetical protein
VSGVLAHVLWIGGPPCSGKTTVAGLLAGRHDLRGYNADVHTWEHHDKAVERGYADATYWQTATPDEIWLADLDTIVAHTLEANAERSRLMLEDLEALPTSPLIVAEGTPLFPWLVADRIADPDHAVFLVPSPAFQRARLLERPRLTFERTSDPPRALENRMRRELEVGALIRRDALERGFHVLDVDGSRTAHEIAGAVEKLFAATIAAGPRASSRPARRKLRRQHNLQVHRQVSSYFARVPGAGDPTSTPVPFVCECGGRGCHMPVHAPLVTASDVFNGTDRRLVAEAHRRDR